MLGKHLSMIDHYQKTNRYLKDTTIDHYQKTNRYLKDTIGLIQCGDITVNKAVEYLLDVQKELHKLGKELKINDSDDN